MIVEALLGLVSWIIDILLFPLEIEELPQKFAEILLMITSFFLRAASIIAAYIDTPYILALLGFVISFNAVLALFDFIMWVLRKIPFINIH